jgi:hypothetical protein
VEQVDLLRHAIRELERQQIPHMVVGSFASMAHGEPRMTRDIDIVLDLRADQVAGLCSAFPAPAFYVSVPAAQEAVRRGGQFNVIHPASGNKIDFILARQDAWGKSQLARRQRVKLLPDLDGYVASPEDVILGKLWYYQEGGSEKHLRDIAGILQLGGTQIDTAYIESLAAQLGVTEPWQAVLSRISRSPG